MQLVLMQENSTMSSRAISELVGSNHSDVKRSIKRLEVDQLLTAPLAEFDFEHNGNTYQEYRLNKRDSILCVARISPAFTAAIIDRWQELEKQHSSFKIPTTLHEALRLAADQSEALQIANEKIAIAAPKVEYYEKIVVRDHLLNATQVSQKVGMSAMKMNACLDGLAVYSKNVKRSRTFQQWFIDKGYGELKQTDSGYPQAMFTLKGEAWIVQKFISEGLI